MTTVTTEPGLRERKRIATKRSIERAVLSLTVERGFDKVTIEDISRVADVSPRTFFNYFTSKDEALIGDIPRIPDGEVMERFVSGQDDLSVIDGLGELFAWSAEHTALEDREVHVLRKAVFSAHPHLLGLRMATMRSFEDSLYALVRTRLLHEGGPLVDTEEAVTEKAWMITLLGFAAMRHAWRCWAENDGQTSLETRLRQSFTQLHDVLG